MENAKTVLENFIQDMKAHEIDREQKSQKFGDEYIFEDDNQQKILNQIIGIQEKYLSDKALSLKQDRRTTLAFRTPPEFDQTIIAENIINKNKVEFTTQDNNKTHLQYKYTVILENGLWKVDKVAYSWMNWKATRQNF